MLKIENLNVEYYRRGQVIHAVRDFSLTLHDGETVGLVGESGSGKSTVALAILRLFRAQEGRITSGKILFDGVDLLSLPENQMRDIRGRRISMIFQDPFTSLNPVMRVREQMQEVLTAHQARSSDQAIKQSSDDIFSRSPDRSIARSLENVQLDPSRVLNAYPHQLSGGQRQRVMIAMALIGQPSLILADEPTTALDVLVQKEILDLLFTLQRDLKVSMLFITHNLAIVAQCAQRIAVMKDGCLVEESNATTLFKNPHHPYTRTLLDSIARLV